MASSFSARRTKPSASAGSGAGASTATAQDTIRWETDLATGQRLAAQTNRLVLVHFWGTWCPVCNFVSPAVNQMSAFYPVVTVAMGSGEDEKLRKYLQHQEYGFDTINDSDSKIARDWSLQATPTIMIFKEGELKHYTTGFTSLPGMWWRMLFT